MKVKIKKLKMKINLSLIKFNEKFEITKFCDDLLIGSRMEYKLYGIINHIGGIYF